MSFNAIITLAAALIGVASAAMAGLRHRGLTPVQLVTALGTGAVGSAVALVITSAITDDIFAVAHMAYLILCIGVPVAAVLMILRATEAPLGGRILLALGLLPALLGLYATHVAPFQLQIDRAEIGGPAAAAGLRIGVLSDLQTGSIGDYESDAIDTLLAEEPDIVLIPGDFWQLDDVDLADRAAEFAAVMRRLDESADHVIAVHGNTDSLAGLRLITDGTDVIVLDNDVVDVSVRGIDVRVGGMSLAGDVNARSRVIDALAAAERETATILFAHKPDVVFGVPAEVRVDIVIAGHTHGGQIQLPGIGPLTVLSGVPRSVGAGGLSEVDGQAIYVSTGVGLERGRAPQIRLGAKPSVGVLTFFDNGTTR